MPDGVLLPDEAVRDLDDYVGRRDGGRALERARQLGPGGTVQEVDLSGLRGRGGGGFPTARKWAGLRREGEDLGDRYVVCNGAEGEPGTFKDRTILRQDPYQVIEGIAVAAMAVEATAAFLCLKEKFTREVAAVTRALAEMSAAGLAGDVPIRLVTGPNLYLFGEEKGLIHAIEGDLPLPRLLPPYEHGLFATGPQMGWSARPGGRSGAEQRSNPTVVNNVETLATVTHVMTKGPAWHRSLGTDASPGLVVATVVGDVVRPGVAEVEMGTPLREVIARVGGGVGEGRTVKAVLSGVANPVLRGDLIDAPVSYEGLADAGAGLGSAGFIVYDDTADMVSVARMASRFLYVESCGQCPPCKLGTQEITTLLERIDDGRGTDDDVVRIGERLGTVTDANRCYLPVEERLLVASIFREFPEDVANALAGRLRGSERSYPVPLIDDIVDGVAHFDTEQPRRRPDWTLA
ncbi:MAG TPA: NADH-ubiquinone oxidoreductase-F iron-sulfur binding region domain-containing protein [Acidimicrobiales bacterium]|nr:NADH-ubiquinone oxidoreductase-F iron-sulfur binding region domain-containing protein [Acidimicrobiales bacterium]